MWITSLCVEHGTGGAEIKRLQNIMLIFIEEYNTSFGEYLKEITILAFCQ